MRKAEERGDLQREKKVLNRIVGVRAERTRDFKDRAARSEPGKQSRWSSKHQKSFKSASNVAQKEDTRTHNHLRKPVAEQLLRGSLRYENRRMMEIHFKKGQGRAVLQAGNY